MSDKGKPALEILEEAVHLLRSMPAAALCLYFIGALPFLLGALYFWADMSEGAFAQDKAGLESLLLVLLFTWMNCWQTAFVAELRGRLSGSGVKPWTLRRIGQMAILQAGIQPTSFLMLPLAALVTLPLARVYAFYQCVNYDSSGAGFGETVEAAWKQSARWPRQNWIILCLISLSGLVCFVNLTLLIFNGAYLLKSLFGVESPITRSVWSMVNSTFFCTVAALTYLAVDPLAKAVYALRCFYGDALSSGEDLRARLRRVPAAKATIAAVFALVMLAPLSAETVPTAELDRAMDSVIQRPEFSWRLPRQAAPPGQNTGVLLLAERMIDALQKMAAGIKQGITDLMDWYQRIFGGDNRKLDLPDMGGTATGMRFFTIFLTVSLLLLGAFAIYRAFSQRAKPAPAVESRAAAAVDITSEAASADQLPEDDWLRMGRDFLAAGDLRLGVRALYLGALANLARRELISLTRSKTNRDYLRELERRARAAPHVLPAFVVGVGIYERTWYGRHAADGAAVQELLSALERMRSDG
ncbi:MAG: DUF4129 domain-containing protein [Bryobacteraceae bacterium]